MTYWAIKDGDIFCDVYHTRVGAIWHFLERRGAPHTVKFDFDRWRESLTQETMNAWRHCKRKGYSCVKVEIKEVS